MILHIAPDEKFIDFAYKEFEKVIPDNKFLVLSESKSKKFKYIKSADITAISNDELLNPNFISKLHEYEFIVLHMLDHYKAQLVLNASDRIKFVWLGWGTDYYSFIVGSDENLFLPNTKMLWKKQNFKTVIKNYIKTIIFHKDSRFKALKRINYFSPVIANEYDLLKSSIGSFQAEYVPFSYANLDDMLKGLSIDNTRQSINLLLGNSASYTNNHIEAIDIISKFYLGERKVITPLSYGDQKYRKYIEKYAQLKIGNHFMPLTDFMDKEHYHKIISTCSIVIMNHLRQQALGNVITMMYLGAKIYLNRVNPIFNFLNEEGACIYDINDFVPENPDAFKTLTDEDVRVNRAILEKYWSVDAVNKKVKELVQIVREGR